MDVDELMALERPLTDEEFVFLEKQLLETVRAFARETEKLCAQAGDAEPELIEKLRAASASMLLNVELAASEGTDGLPQA